MSRNVVIGGIGACVILMLAAVVGTLVVEGDRVNREIVATSNPVVVTENAKKLQICLDDQRRCVGTFLKWRISGRITRITKCDFSCGRFETSFVELEQLKAAHGEHGFAASIEEIVPFTETTAWEKMAVEYVRQLPIHD